ncbi:MAG: hypothetical protein HKN16_13825, partial [Saprospiraceae bacterium]|nr:hypothetical protein [Saprospiraceae bacterium]
MLRTTILILILLGSEFLMAQTGPDTRITISANQQSVEDILEAITEQCG